MPVTIHIPLNDVLGALSTERILKTLAIDGARRSPRYFGIARPRIAVAGLNPHAGEDGTMGREEIEIIAPAVARLRGAGPRRERAATPPTRCSTPRRARPMTPRVAMYHDQALIPIKTLAFETGVNVTLGLPFVRTSPDHGTAFRLAGTGRASPRSLIAALAPCRHDAAERGRSALSSAGRPAAASRRHPRLAGLPRGRALGQNFLLDLNLTRRIARAAGPLEGTTIVEIGPGPGGLTRALLAGGAARVIAIEKDARCLPALAEIAAAYPGRLEIVAGDALRGRFGAARSCGRPARIVANLPYNVATPLLIGWLKTEPWPPWFDRLVLMFQREVARRIVAKPGSEDLRPPRRAQPMAHRAAHSVHPAAAAPSRRRRKSTRRSSSSCRSRPPQPPCDVSMRWSG